MSLFVNTNISSLTAQRNLFSFSMQLDKSFERLSSGFRINGASDDAAGLQISDRLSSQINGLNQAVRNANDAISVTQTADGALSETVGNLQRLRQLAIQSQNGINSLADKTALQKEAQELVEEINRISTDTQFAGQNLLDGTYSAAFLVGANAGQTITVSLTQFSGIGFGQAGLGLNGLDVITGTTAGFNTDAVKGVSEFDTITDDIFLIDNTNPAGTYRFSVSNDGGQTYSQFSVNLAGNDNGTISSDGDAIANAINNTLGGSIVQSVSSGTITIVETVGIQPNLRVAADTNNPSTFQETKSNVGSFGGGSDIIEGIDQAISRVNGIRAELGASQNRFQSTIRNLANISENLNASRSQIRARSYSDLR